MKAHGRLTSGLVGGMSSSVTAILTKGPTKEVKPMGRERIRGGMEKSMMENGRKARSKDMEYGMAYRETAI